MAKDSKRQGGLTQEVYKRISQDIIKCVLLPGQVLNEGELAASFGVSKTPVREALMRLQQTNLVEVIPRRGYMVSTLSLRDIQEIFEVRQILERAVYSLSINYITDSEIDELEGIKDTYFLPDDPNCGAAYIDANNEFHMKIALATRNQRLMRQYENILVDANRLMHLDLKHLNAFGSWQEGHQCMIDALRARDEAALVAASEKALNDGRIRLLNL